MTAVSNTAVLYTPDILGLAVDLANYPIEDHQTLSADVRSRSCGSRLTLAVKAGPERNIESLGLRVSACAIGQAAAALFARSAIGRHADDIEGNHGALLSWLKGNEDPPDWPEISLLAKAIPYPARHEAILLPWRAAMAALSKGDPDR